VPDWVREQMGGLLEVMWAAKTRTELRVIEEIEATDAAKTDGWASTKDFVTAICGGRHGHGGSAVRLARALATDRARVGEELANARISRHQEQVIVRCSSSRSSSVREDPPPARKTCLSHGTVRGAHRSEGCGRCAGQLDMVDATESRDPDEVRVLMFVDGTASC